MEPSNKYDLTSLLIEKSFDQLSEEERAFAMSELEGPAAYDEMRSIIVEAPNLESPAPSPDLKSSLMVAFDEAKEEEKVIPIVRKSRRPLWVAIAAACLIALVSTIYIRQNLDESTQYAEVKTPKEAVTDSLETKNTSDNDSAAEPMEQGPEGDTSTSVEEEEQLIAENKPAIKKPEASSIEVELADEIEMDEVDSYSEIAEEEPAEMVEDDIAETVLAQANEKSTSDSEGAELRGTRSDTHTEAYNSTHPTVELDEQVIVSADMAKSKSANAESITSARVASESKSRTTNMRVPVPPKDCYTAY